MSVQFDHVAIAANDKVRSATFLSGLLGLPDPVPGGPFLSVHLEGGVHLDYADVPFEFPGQHYALLVSDDVFDRALAGLQADGATYWPDPRMSVEGEINHHHGGRGVYFDDPAGHHFELITAPYGADLT